MKKNYLLIVIVFISITGKAQTNIYHPLPDSNAVWTVHAFITNQPPTISYLDFNYVIGNDTVIGVHTYRKIQQIGSRDDFYPPTFQHNYSWFNYYAGAIRQDTLARKVYFTLQSFNVDSLLFDFNLNIGDTIKTHVGNCYGMFSIYVTSIDSVLVGTHYNKRFNVNTGLTGNQDTSLIEGIGTTNGLFESFFEFEGGATLLCFSRDGQTLFPTYSTGMCAPLSVNEKIFNNNSITISPNPFNTETTITFAEEQKHATIKITDLLGKEIKTIHLTGRQATIEKGNINAGIYFVQTTDEKNNVTNKKIIIQ